jgi:hypothetical protein
MNTELKGGQMQYMLLIYDDENVWSSLSEDERNRMMDEYWAFTDDVRKAGKYVAGDALQSINTAKSVRVRDDDVSMTDGPFAETKEQLGGYYLSEADSDEEALEWAAKIPSAKLGTIEVRPVVAFTAPAPAS